MAANNVSNLGKSGQRQDVARPKLRLLEHGKELLLTSSLIVATNLRSISSGQVPSFAHSGIAEIDRVAAIKSNPDLTVAASTVPGIWDVTWRFVGHSIDTVA